jgi:hypothetical protein
VLLSKLIIVQCVGFGEPTIAGMPALDLLKVQPREIRLHANSQKSERFRVALAATERISCWLATPTCAY